MSAQLAISIGQYSDKGRKPLNQDFHGAVVPKEPLLSTKGTAICLADGISSSEVSQYASEAAVKGFLEDYYSTPESWTVKTSVQRVLKASNSWLYLQTRNSPYRYSPDKGYVCTFSTLVLKSNTAHIFHAGDTRIYRVVNNRLEQLTEDHRLWVSREKSYLQRALGIKDYLQLDYQDLSVEVGDVFLLATDGVYEFASETFIVDTIKNNTDLDHAAKLIVKEAFEKESDDNLSLQIVRIDQLPKQEAGEAYQQMSSLPFPPELKPRMLFDGYEIVREIQISHRSHIFLALDTETKEQVVIKVPSVDQRNNSEYIERFLMEEWVARRINNAHVLKPCSQTRKRNYLYIVTEFVEGQTLRQWLIDHPEPDLEFMRTVVEQIASGLRALHRQEMLHQDIRPENIMIDKTGTARIIDFGSTRVAGLNEINTFLSQEGILGTAQYTAPEYFIGELGNTRSDLYSLAAIAYEMLSHRLPYGANVARATTKSAQQKLVYQSVLDDTRTIPAWIDATLRKALNPDPYKRYERLSEFVYDLRNPNKAFISKTLPPLIERNPVLVWKTVSFILMIIVLVLIFQLTRN